MMRIIALEEHFITPCEASIPEIRLSQVDLPSPQLGLLILVRATWRPRRAWPAGHPPLWIAAQFLLRHLHGRRIT